MRYLIFLIPLIFLLACTSTEEPVSETPEPLAGQAITPTEEAPPPPAEIPCTSGWKCLGNWDKSYQNEDCNWSPKVGCPLGCLDGECRKGKTCDSGFKCIDETKMGFQTETCLWINTKKCAGGCLDGECLEPLPQNETENETIVEEEVPVEEPIEEDPSLFTLALSETVRVTTNQGEYNLTLYDLQSDQARLKVDDFRSEWVMEGHNFTHQNNIIIIKEILFQPYEGGTRVASFTIK